MDKVTGDGAQRIRRCQDAAVRYLAHRPQSEAELGDKLRRRGFDDDSVRAVLARLKGNGLVNDSAFAEYWKENRESFRPRSQRLTRLELERKGVARDIVDQVVGTVDDNDNAYRLALGWASHTGRGDYGAFRRRLGEYLRRRGFSYDVVSHTVDLVWRELGTGRVPGQE